MSGYCGKCGTAPGYMRPDGSCPTCHPTASEQGFICPDQPVTGPNMIARYEGEYAWLSNFYSHAIPYKGVVYPSVEHAYQAAKFDEPKHRELIRTAGSAADAKAKAKSLLRYQHSDWNDRKLRVMHALNWLKFQDTYLQRKLLATGTRKLVEGNDWNDRFWGVCKGAGSNYLGRTHMMLRMMAQFSATQRLYTGRYNPWHEVFEVASVQRDWESYVRGALQHYNLDWRQS